VDEEEEKVETGIEEGESSWTEPRVDEATLLPQGAACTAAAIRVASSSTVFMAGDEGQRAGGKLSVI